ncbi:site-2 protease family protein [Paludisphaera rhizosphaerae]|uniref:site-2 protease family protein n=1 Tax=Paludisphaera rhizosphaerae TaxID=2711216 RepID=UPI0013EA6298|nr:site-2 protease family protein [Paludisphaera rhizosphaerae]
MLVCPSCHRLVHAERLTELAAEAQAAETRADWSTALGFWRDAVDLLPNGTRQRDTIVARIADLGRKADASPTPSPVPAQADPSTSANGWSAGAAAGGLGALAMVALKFKFVLLALVTKGKLLIGGLLKGGSTFWTMLAATGVYWTAFGLPFAIGLVLSIYVHEMGHVAALRRYGVRASAPMFIPGLGAVVRLGQALHDPRQDARVGLAGPIWGLAASVACAGIFYATGQPLYAALARVGAFVNLFNLIPFWQLDGGRAFRSLNRPQRWLAVAALATSWSVTHDGIVLLLIFVAVAATIFDKPAEQSDAGVLGWYAFLVAALSALAFAPYLRVGAVL